MTGRVDAPHLWWGWSGGQTASSTASTSDAERPWPADARVVTNGVVVQTGRKTR